MDILISGLQYVWMIKNILVQPKFSSGKGKGEAPMNKCNYNWRQINKIIKDQLCLHPVGYAGSMYQLQLKDITDYLSVKYPKIQ